MSVETEDRVVQCLDMANDAARKADGAASPGEAQFWLRMEARGYVERRPEKGRRAVLIHLTRRGWRFYETQWAAMKQLEDEWAAIIGKKRFEECLDTLRRLKALDAAAAGPARATEERPQRSGSRAGKRRGADGSR
jgi:hypothetical protein